MIFGERCIDSFSPSVPSSLSWCTGALGKPHWRIERSLLGRPTLCARTPFFYTRRGRLAGPPPWLVVFSIGFLLLGLLFPCVRSCLAWWPSTLRLPLHFWLRWWCSSSFSPSVSSFPVPSSLFSLSSNPPSCLFDSAPFLSSLLPFAPLPYLAYSTALGAGTGSMVSCTLFHICIAFSAAGHAPALASSTAQGAGTGSMVSCTLLHTGTASFAA